MNDDARLDAAEQIELCYANDWTDGLPVIPPAPHLVNEMLRAVRLEPDTVIATMASRRVGVTAEKIAANALMAGCRPEYMPVVIAAVKALALPSFGLHHAAAALAGPTIMIFVNGPIAKKLGINDGVNLLGPGPAQRANATIGRALRLILLNCLRYIPGTSDRATFGTPGKYTCCIAENEENHPWEPWHVECGFKPTQSTVTLVGITTMIQVWNYGNHEQMLRTIGKALSFEGSIALLERTPGTVIFGGEHAEMLRASGWSKQRIKECIFEHTANSVAELKRAGRIDGPITPEDERTVHYAIPKPEDLMLVCAGGPVGALSLVLPGPGSERKAGRSASVPIEEI